MHVCRRKDIHISHGATLSVNKVFYLPIKYGFKLVWLSVWIDRWRQTKIKKNLDHTSKLEMEEECGCEMRATEPKRQKKEVKSYMVHTQNIMLNRRCATWYEMSSIYRIIPLLGSFSHSILFLSFCSPHFCISTFSSSSIDAILRTRKKKTGDR